MRVHLVSGYDPDPVRQEYDYRARATDAFDRCIAHLREELAAHLVRNNGGSAATGVVVTAEERRFPPTAAAVKGGWKKLHALAEAAKDGAYDVLIWHDADALPTKFGPLIEYVQRIVSKQPTVALWLQPGQLFRHARLSEAQRKHWPTFGGLDLQSIGHQVRNFMDLQTGVLVVRASHAALVTDALELYNATAEASGKLVEHLLQRGVPRRFVGAQEQGPLTHHLLQRTTAGSSSSSNAGAVRLVPWLQCEAIDGERGCAQSWNTTTPGFYHYSGCGYDQARARRCLSTMCPDRGSGQSVTRSTAASWSAGKAQAGPWRWRRL